MEQKKYYKVGIIIPTFCDQGYLRDRDEQIHASSESEAIEIYKRDYAFKYYLNDDEKRAVARGTIKIGIVK